MQTTTLVSRQTRLGLLTVGITGGELTVTLGDKTLDACVQEGLPAGAPAAGPLGTFGGTVSRTVLLYTSELAAIRAAQEAARAARLETLPGQREALAAALANCEPGAYPGSAAHSQESAALAALAAFDLAHPEVVASLRGTTPAPTGETALEGAQ